MNTEPARVVGTITPRAPYGIDPPESPAERAAHAALMALADLYIALGQIGTVEDALRLQRATTEISEQFGFIAQSALRKADALCGAQS